ncbi:MAG: hypothetical protein QME16_00200 [Planctomycetota bacterium]|nr:hypothetical protein [Planctomycetota bacterium]
MNWKEVLWQQCKQAYYRGGEVKVAFIKRGQSRVILVYPLTPEPIRCDEETVVSEED